MSMREVSRMAEERPLLGHLAPGGGSAPARGDEDAGPSEPPPPRHTESCPFCGEDNLPLAIQNAGSCRYLGWFCPNCNLTGVLGIHTDPPSRSRPD